MSETKDGRWRIKMPNPSVMDGWMYAVLDQTINPPWRVDSDVRKATEWPSRAEAEAALRQSPRGINLVAHVENAGIREMGAELANALITEAHLRDGELEMMIDHYRGLEALLRVSGPRFGQARSWAVDMHNRAVRRANGIRQEAKRRETEAQEGRLMEIS